MNKGIREKKRQEKKIKTKCPTCIILYSVGIIKKVKKPWSNIAKYNNQPIL